MSPVRYRPSDLVDFVVIGAGAAGGVVAKELATSGFQVVVLEQGPYLRAKDFTHDEVDVLFRAALINDPKKQPNTFRRTPNETAKRRQSIEYARLVGGGSVHFTANYWRFHPDDFRERSLLDAIPGADLQDWPITYDELEPYYTKAEWELGISGLAGSNPFDGPRSKPYPLPPMPVKGSGVLFERGARKLGYNPFPAPVAVLSRPYRGRSACVHCGWCEAFGCEMNAKSSTLAALLPLAESTGRCEIRPESYVRKIETGPDGRVTGAIYFDREGREMRQRARAVVLCANGAETPRLLLMSGLANSSGLVGKYLMFDGGLFAYGLYEHMLNEYKSIVVTRVLHDFYASDPKRGFYGGGGLDSRMDMYPATFALNGMPKDEPQWGAEWKRGVGRYYTHTSGILAHSSCLAVEQNSISLDPDLKDAWGLPAIRVTFRNHPDDLKAMRFLVDRQVEILQASGATKIWSDPVEEVSYSRHLMGTCRMGNDPRTSVVDRWNRAHDVRNLFIVDGSSLVTCGRQQPTETIQALAYRAAEHMAESARRGEI
ncbi:MAG: GMC family oxidoreductase [Acidobacteriaceae bacterium]|nr:GMC family oxidoreductase [Acidobacteriaceae bacterium]